MNADWDDAPVRVRKKSDHAGILVSIAITVGIFSAAIYTADSKGWLDTSNQQLPAIVTTPEAKPEKEQSVEEWLREYDAKVFEELAQRRAQELAEQQRLAELAKPTPQEPPPRQTVFNDSNYTPRRDVNTISMNTPSQSTASVLQQQARPNRQYVTVVEETKRSCWPLEEGSAACRRFKQQVLQSDRRACELNGNSYACERANRYDLR